MGYDIGFPSASVALGGGMLIGLSATIFLLMNGRVTGISNIVAGMAQRPRNQALWRWFFVLGLLGGGVTLLYLFPQAFEVPATNSAARLSVAGLLVGFGAQIAHGCTSGHGVCGLSRRSFRSMAATLMFMLTGMATVYLVDQTVIEATQAGWTRGNRQ